MTIRLAAMALAGAVALAGCQSAGVGDKADAPVVKLVRLDVVENNPKAGRPVAVAMPYKVDKVGVWDLVEICVAWSGEKPNCSKATADRQLREIRKSIRNKKAGEYRVSAYIRYISNGFVRKSNSVARKITLK